MPNFRDIKGSTAVVDIAFMVRLVTCVSKD